MDTKVINPPAKGPAKDPTKEHERNTTRLTWLDAKGELSIEEHVLFGSAKRLVVLVDADGEEMGRGESLMDAIDDAMGSASVGVAR